ncbi:MAG TPA: hypothetical protein VF992_01435 [Thermoplasmata archaeon]
MSRDRVRRVSVDRDPEPVSSNFVASVVSGGTFWLLSQAKVGPSEA